MLTGSNQSPTLLVGSVVLVTKTAKVSPEDAVSREAIRAASWVGV